MSRTTKTGLDYFPLDTNLDEKFEMIEAEHGLIGFAIIIKIFQEIYNNGYYYLWDKKRKLLFSKRNNVDINNLNVIINSALEWNMFSEQLFNDYNILTSVGIQRQFLKITERRKEVIINEKIWLINNIADNDNIVFINDDILPLNDDIKKQSKGESKGESKVPDCPHLKIQKLFAEILPELPQIKSYDKNREKIVRTRWRENPTLDYFRAYFDKVKESDFLMRRCDNDFIASFDWLMKPKNMRKVIEGNYINRKNKKSTKFKDIGEDFNE